MGTADLLASLELDITACRRCPRLVAWREQVSRERRRAYLNQEYWGLPVPGWGDPEARLLVVGLAPAAHGANRTGRLFTGDASGDFLFAALHRVGFASQPVSSGCQDGLRLHGIFITAACRCAPPENAPTPAELEACLPFLIREFELLPRVQGVVALGQVALRAVVATWRKQGWAIPRPVFGHARWLQSGPGLPWLLASYHPSRQNTQTGRLSPEQFDRVWRLARDRLEG